MDVAHADTYECWCGLIHRTTAQLMPGPIRLALEPGQGRGWMVTPLGMTLPWAPREVTPRADTEQ